MKKKKPGKHAPGNNGSKESLVEDKDSKDKRYSPDDLSEVQKRREIDVGAVPTKESFTDRKFKCISREFPGFKGIMPSDLPRQFRLWLLELTRYGNLHRSMLLMENVNRLSEISTYQAVFYTMENKYFITAKISRLKEEKDSYLSCRMTQRKSLPGSDWFKGYDLPDGKFTALVWNAIKCSIISTEIKNLMI